MALNEISNSIGGKGYTNYLQNFSLANKYIFSYIQKHIFTIQIKEKELGTILASKIIQQICPIIIFLNRLVFGAK